MHSLVIHTPVAIVIVIQSHSNGFHLNISKHFNENAKKITAN